MLVVRRFLLPLVGIAVAAVFLLTFVFPTRTFLAQRTSISRAEHQVRVLQEQRAELERQAEALQDDAEIERLAREQYSLVRPGEEAYALLPAPGEVEAPTAVDDGDDEDDEDDEEPPRNLLRRAWDAITSLL